MNHDPKGDAYAWNAHNRCGDISVSEKVNQSIHGPRSLGDRRSLGIPGPEETGRMKWTAPKLQRTRKRKGKELI
jgi:hypothetical protein